MVTARTVAGWIFIVVAVVGFALSGVNAMGDAPSDVDPDMVTLIGLPMWGVMLLIGFGLVLVRVNSGRR